MHDNSSHVYTTPNEPSLILGIPTTSTTNSKISQLHHHKSWTQCFWHFYIRLRFLSIDPTLGPKAGCIPWAQTIQQIDTIMVFHLPTMSQTFYRLKSCSDPSDFLSLEIYYGAIQYITSYILNSPDCLVVMVSYCVGRRWEIAWRSKVKQQLRDRSLEKIACILLSTV